MKLKFLTINIWNGILLDHLIPFLEKENSDIILMQEVYNGKDDFFERRFRSFTILEKELGYKFNAFVPSFIDTRTIGEIENGNAIFSKFPIEEKKIIFFDVPFGKFDEEHSNNFEYLSYCMQQVLIKIKKESLNVFNVHGIWGLDGLDNKRRLEMSEIIISHIKDKNRTILAGDFNAAYKTKTIKNIEKYLLNLFKDELTTTFNMKRKNDQRFAAAVVDGIFVSKDLKVNRHNCLNVDISDHLPLVCEFEL